MHESFTLLLNGPDVGDADARVLAGPCTTLSLALSCPPGKIPASQLTDIPIERTRALKRAPRPRLPSSSAFAPGEEEEEEERTHERFQARRSGVEWSDCPARLGKEEGGGIDAGRREGPRFCIEGRVTPSASAARKALRAKG